MENSNSNDQLFTEFHEDAFVNIKEACVRLQERTKCSNSVVIEMLHNVADFYIELDKKSIN